MVKNCLNCGKEFEAKRESAKYCSDNCRVKWNWKNKGKKKKLTFQVAEKTLLDLIERLDSKINFIPTTPASYDAPKVNKYVADEAGQWQQPLKVKTELDFLNDISECEEEFDYKKVYEEIKASDLREGAKDRLYQNMKISKMNR